MEMKKYKLGEIAFITKLAGFEHTKYIQGKCVHTKIDESYIPLFIGKTVRDGKIDTDFDWYISKKIANQLPRSYLKRKCLVLPYVGSLGDLAVFDASYEALLGSNIAKIELNHDCCYSEEFVYYYLKSPNGKTVLLRDEQGGVQKNITMESIRNVILPPIDRAKQNKIVNVLSSLDKKIALNRSINTKLEAMAKRLYDYWFVQFDFPNADGKPYKSSCGKMVWNEVLKREIPEGWEVKRLGDVLNNKMVSAIAGNHLKGMDYCPIDEIPMRTMSFAGGKSYLEANSSLQLYEKKDILIGAMRVYFHRCCIASKPGITRTTTIVLQPKEKKHLSYLYQICNEEKTFDYAMKVSNGTQQPYVTWNALGEYQFTYPNNSEVIDSFCKKTEQIVNKILINVKEIHKLTILRDHLLPLLMNGQVEVG